MSRKGGTRGGGWVHPKGENGVVQPWTGRGKPLLGAGWAVSLVFCMNGHRKQSCHLVGPPFQAPTAFFVLERVGIAHANILISEWAWPGLQTYSGWLALPLCAVWSMKTRENWI